MKLVATAGLIPTSFRTLPRSRAVRAATVQDAVAAIADAEQPAVIAGGTDLPARFNEGFWPTDLIDISRIEALRQISVQDGALVIGATVTHAAGSTDPVVQNRLPGFARAWSRIANVRIRLSATLGGNLMARRTRYEGAILLSALDARLRLHNADGPFEIAADAVWTDPRLDQALLTAIVIPVRRGLRLDYARELRPLMTQAVAIDDSGAGRVVTATEYAVPCCRALTAQGDSLAPVGTLDLADPTVGSAYLQSTSGVLLRRQLERIRS